MEQGFILPPLMVCHTFPATSKFHLFQVLLKIAFKVLQARFSAETREDKENKMLNF